MKFGHAPAKLRPRLRVNARVLQEEFEKREELEAIKSELERLLVEEQSKSGELEERRGRQEALYREEMARLEALEAERRQRNEEYQVDTYLFSHNSITKFSC